MDGIVSVEIDEKSSEACIWRRSNGTVVNFNVSFRPWLLSSFRNGGRAVRLKGQNEIRWMHEYGSIEQYRSHYSSFPYPKSLILSDFRRQFLIKNPDYYLFQGMRFGDLVRFTLDIETTGMNPETDRILMIAISGTNFAPEVLRGPEPQLIELLNQRIQWADPDIIEGWNIYGFDIPFLMHRAKVHGMELNWGRGSEAVIKGRTWKFRVGSFDRPVRSYNVYGRHFVDGMLVAMRYDANTGGNFESFGLKHVAEKMGVQQPDRVFIPGECIAEEWERNPDRVVRYALQDVQETQDLIELMVQPEFYLTTQLPDTFQNVLLSGSATKVNLMLVSQYVRLRHSIPTPPKEREEYEGAKVELRESGVFYNVAKADVASLYPTIMLYTPVGPATDELGLFHEILRELTERRLRIKKDMKETQDEHQRLYLKGVQESFKILINSFYGYLGAGLHFSDFEAAAKVTRIGREVVVDMADQLEALGLRPIELDTDGVFFQYPDGFPLESIPMFLSMPEYITVEVEEPYRAMVSVKAKNYVLLKHDGKLEFCGNSLRSRRDEGFGRKFIDSAVRVILEGRPEAVVEIYKTWQQKILERTVDPSDLARYERISDKTLTSSMKYKLRMAVEQTNLGEGDYIKIYQTETGEYRPIEMYKADEDRFYYLQRLYMFAKRLDNLLKDHEVKLERIYKRDWYKLAGIEPPCRKSKQNELIGGLFSE